MSLGFDMPDLHCRHRLPSPEAAGYATKGKLLEVAQQYPHLRPCPKHRGSKGTWEWLERKDCEKCAEAVEIESPGVEPGKKEEVKAKPKG